MEKSSMQEVIAYVIELGYQLTEEAFKLLSETPNPLEIIKETIENIKKNNLDIIFITDKHIEEILKIDKKTLIIPPPKHIEKEIPKIEEKKEKKIIKIEEYKTEIDIIKNPGEDLKVIGTIKDFKEYFFNRYQKIKKILSSRPDNFIPISEIKKIKNNEEASTIAMIYDKRETKKAIILECEDPSGKTTFIAPRTNEEVYFKCEKILMDQVVGLKIRRANDLFIIQDVIQPDIPIVNKSSKEKIEFPELYVALISDLHIGSEKFCEEAFMDFLKWLKESDEGKLVKYLIICGDLIDGVGIYPNQEKELKYKSINLQLEKALQLLLNIPNYINVIIIPGNHDPVRKALPQPAYPKKYVEKFLEKRNFIFLGNPSEIALHKRRFLLYHGQSFDDFIQYIPGLTYSTLKENIDKLLEVIPLTRHLAPVYGGTALTLPLQEDLLVLETIPDILHVGHIHVAGIKKYRGLTIINSGTFQKQTHYQKGMGLDPTPPSIALLNLQDLSVRIIFFE
jgi:DNA polymerase II small subunit